MGDVTSGLLISQATVSAPAAFVLTGHFNNAFRNEHMIAVVGFRARSIHTLRAIRTAAKPTLVGAG